VEQIITKLREAENLQGQGLTIPATCKRLGISDQAVDISMVKDLQRGKW